MCVRGLNNVGRTVQTEQHCCTRLRRSRNKRNVGSCWLKRLTSFKFRATTPSNTQQDEQRDATCNISSEILNSMAPSFELAIVQVMQLYGQVRRTYLFH